MGGRYPAFRSAADVNRRIQQGFGQGRGVAYRPWLRVQEVPSRGRSHKVAGVKIARTHHVLSDLEAACLFALEFQRSVVDIREQFPLLPVEATQAAASLLGVRHPTYPGTVVPLVLTTDFCADLTSRDAAKSTSQVAIAVKYSQDLTNSRVRELLAIEHDTNVACGRRWFLFTEETLSPVIIRNLKWLRYGACFTSTNTNNNELVEFSSAFLASHHNAALLSVVLTHAARQIGIANAEAIQMFRLAAWHHILHVSLSEPITLQRPLTLAENDYELLDFSDAHSTAEG